MTPSAVEDLARVLGPSHPNVATGIHSLGELQRRLGRIDEARRTLERCLAIYEKALAHDDAVLIDPLTSLGLVDETQGRTEAAIEHLGRAVAILQKWPGLSALDPRPEYARVLRKAGRIAEAERIEASIRSASATP